MRWFVSRLARRGCGSVPPCFRMAAIWPFSLAMSSLPGCFAAQGQALDEIWLVTVSIADCDGLVNASRKVGPVLQPSNVEGEDGHPVSGPNHVPFGWWRVGPRPVDARVPDAGA